MVISFSVFIDCVRLEGGSPRHGLIRDDFLIIAAPELIFISCRFEKESRLERAFLVAL